jgi:hypothetical protein
MKRQFRWVPHLFASLRHLNAVHFSHSSREAYQEDLRTCDNLQWVILQTERGLREAPWTQEDEEAGKKIIIWFGEEKRPLPWPVDDVDGGQDVEVRLVHKSTSLKEGEFRTSFRSC